MENITLISGTNRPSSYTLRVATYYKQLLQNDGFETQLLTLEQLPANFLFSETFGNRTEAFQLLIDTYVLNSNKFVFVAPEYNGSFPGILKGFLDAVPPSYWNGKKAALLGVAQGRAGNLRGIEQLTLILNYLKVNVLYNKLPISVVDTLFDDAGNLTHIPTQNAISMHKDAFVKF